MEKLGMKQTTLTDIGILLNEAVKVRPKPKLN